MILVKESDVEAIEEYLANWHKTDAMRAQSLLTALSQARLGYPNSQPNAQDTRHHTPRTVHRTQDTTHADRTPEGGQGLSAHQRTPVGISPDRRKDP